MTEPWLGHRDLCPVQWQQPCDCEPPTVVAPHGSQTKQCDDAEPHGSHGEWYGKGDGPDSWWCPGIQDGNH